MSAIPRCALLASLLSGSLSCVGLWALEEYRAGRMRGEPASDRWIRIQHPELPISFEVPDNAATKLEYPGFGALAEPSRPMLEVLKFGIRGVSFGDGVLYALEVAFFRVTAANVGVEEHELGLLHSHIERPEVAQELFRRAFLDHLAPSGVPNARFRDLGAATIDGRPARGFHGERRVSWRVEAGRIVPCEDCAYGDYEIYVVPLDARAALVVWARFLAETPEERRVVFPRILRSIRIESAPER